MAAATASSRAGYDTTTRRSRYMGLVSPLLSTKEPNFTASFACSSRIRDS